MAWIVDWIRDALSSLLERLGFFSRTAQLTILGAQRDSGFFSFLAPWFGSDTTSGSRPERLLAWSSLLRPRMCWLLGRVVSVAAVLFLPSSTFPLRLAHAYLWPAAVSTPARPPARPTRWLVDTLCAPVFAVCMHVAGLDNAGKTSLIHRLASGQVAVFNPTIVRRPTIVRPPVVCRLIAPARVCVFVRSVLAGRRSALARSHSMHGTWAGTRHVRALGHE
jgi:hypothetical protein